MSSPTYNPQACPRCGAAVRVVTNAQGEAVLADWRLFWLTPDEGRGALTAVKEDGEIVVGYEIEGVSPDMTAELGAEHDLFYVALSHESTCPKRDPKRDPKRGPKQETSNP